MTALLPVVGKVSLAFFLIMGLAISGDLPPQNTITNHPHLIPIPSSSLASYASNNPLVVFDTTTTPCLHQTGQRDDDRHNVDITTAIKLLSNIQRGGGMFASLIPAGYVSEARIFSRSAEPEKLKTSRPSRFILCTDVGFFRCCFVY
jgi:hypothetical protein